MDIISNLKKSYEQEFKQYIFAQEFEKKILWAGIRKKIYYEQELKTKTTVKPATFIFVYVNKNGITCQQII